METLTIVLGAIGAVAGLIGAVTGIWAVRRTDEANRIAEQGVAVQREALEAERQKRAARLEVDHLTASRVNSHAALMA